VGRNAEPPPADGLDNTVKAVKGFCSAINNMAEAHGKLLEAPFGRSLYATVADHLTPWYLTLAVFAGLRLGKTAYETRPPPPDATVAQDKPRAKPAGGNDASAALRAQTAMRALLAASVVLSGLAAWRSGQRQSGDPRGRAGAAWEILFAFVAGCWFGRGTAALREWPVSTRLNHTGVGDDDPTMVERVRLP